MVDTPNYFHINEDELMQYYGYVGRIGKLQLKSRLIRSWILHSLAYSSPHPGFAVQMQRTRGVKIGKNCYIAPYVQIDILYPNLVKIEDNVAIGSNTMIFAHVNMPTNLILKKQYPRKISEVTIKSGAWINPGCTITAGVTIGQNSILAIGSVVTSDVPDHCLVAGMPARVVKKLES